MATEIQPTGHLGGEPRVPILAHTTAMHEEQLQPDIEALAPRFEALGLADIAARLRALAVAAELTPEMAAPPALGSLLTQQLLSILAETDEGQ